MRRRKIKDIEVKQYSVSNPQVIIERYALLFYEKELDTISLAYQEADAHKVYLTLEPDQIACMRLGESNTYCHFKLHEVTSLIKESEYGNHHLLCQTKELLVDEATYKVVYDLYFEADYVDTITMQWEVGNEN